MQLEILLTSIAIVPFSLIFQQNEYHKPVLVVDALRLLRLAKILPLIELFDFLKSQNMQKWRVIEVLVMYYLICHVFSCVWISMGRYLSEDVRETWIRRIPVPQESGMRESRSMDDIADLSLYVHSFYFIVNTISHVAIGDITAVTSFERVFVAVLILFGTFIYSFLYGNIVSIVSDLAPERHISQFEKYQFVMQRLEKIKDKQRILPAVNEYFDYIWRPAQQSATIEDELLADIPKCIRRDILLCQYQEAIENSLIFKDEQGAIDVSLTNSILRFMETRMYMTGEYIFKVGSPADSTCFILEGEAIMVGPCFD